MIPAGVRRDAHIDVVLSSVDRGRAPAKTSQVIAADLKRWEAHINTIFSTVQQLGPPRWIDAQVQWEKFVIYVETNLLPDTVKPKLLRARPTERVKQAAQKSKNRQHGPEPGSVGYNKADLRLYPKMMRLYRKHGSARAAAFKLIEEGLVTGSGSAENLAKRLAARFLKELRRRNSTKLAETR